MRSDTTIKRVYRTIKKRLSSPHKFMKRKKQRCVDCKTAMDGFHCYGCPFYKAEQVEKYNIKSKQ